MAVAWYLVPYIRRDLPGGVPARYPAIVDFDDQIKADGGKWAESEVLGDRALVKVNASQATLTAISGAAGFFTIPARFNRLETSFSDLTNGERNQITNAVLSLGYTQAEIDTAMGTSLGQWRTKTLDDFLSLVTTRRLKPRYDAGTDTIILDGPVQQCRTPQSVDGAV